MPVNSEEAEYGVTTELVRQIEALSLQDRQLIQELVAFLSWRGQERRSPDAALGWTYNFLEHMDDADVRASRPGGMEVKAAVATVGDEERPALWQHPPVKGESIVEFHVPVPANVKNPRLRFATGIRDGSLGKDQLVAFRVRVDGWQVWSNASWPRRWESAETPLPFHAGNVLRVAFVTDAMGHHEFAWAAWAEPRLVGEVEESAAG